MNATVEFDRAGERAFPLDSSAPWLPKVRGDLLLSRHGEDDRVSFVVKDRSPPEMNGHAKIDAGERRLLDLVSRRLVRFVKVEFWSWW